MRSENGTFKKGSVPWNKGLKGIMPTPWNKGLEKNEYKKHFRTFRCLGGCGIELSDWGYCERCRRKESRLEKCREGGRTYVELYGGWSGFHKSFREENPEEYLKVVKGSGEKGRRTSFLKYGEDCFCQFGKKGGNTTKERHPDLYRTIGEKTAETNRKNGTGPFDKAFLERMIASSLSSRRRGKPIRLTFSGVSFDSKEEKKLGELLFRMGLPFKERETVHVLVGKKEFDFRITGIETIKEGTFIEYHPYDRDGKSPEEYYLSRRKVLDENGYRDELIVFTSIKEARLVFNDCKIRNLQEVKLC